MMRAAINSEVREAWRCFLGSQENKGHVDRFLAGHSIDEHVAACERSAAETAKRVMDDAGDLTPVRIVEIGCSTGLNCRALKKAYPAAEVIGIEPEAEAILVARAMAAGEPDSALFLQGLGEAIPLEDGSVDLILCHTVIEHVEDVRGVIRECARLLSRDGVVHLDAPNYVWPYEPHLRVWTIPLFGKWFVKLSAILQGKGKVVGFLDHLNFVTPFQLEKLFRENGLSCESRAVKKLCDAAAGRADVRQYRLASRLLMGLQRIGAGALLVRVLVRLGLYPSVMYTIRKTDRG